MKPVKVLILYPDEFNVQAKFIRKVSNILQDMEEIEIELISDTKSLIKGFVDQSSKNISIKKLDNFQEANCSHAIVFDDGDVFKEELAALKANKTSTRIIKVLITRVVNIDREKQYSNRSSTSTYEYIGRGSYWGNPHSMFENGDTREEVIRKYEYDFQFDKFPNKAKDKVFELAGKRLGCFCKPYPCHGDVLAGFLNSYDDEK